MIFRSVEGPMSRQLTWIAVIAFALAPAYAQSGDLAIDSFFQSFTEEWLQLDPQTATAMKFFPAQEQLRLDGLLTDTSPAHTRKQLDLIRRAQHRLRKFDRKQLSSSRRVAASASAKPIVPRRPVRRR